LIPSAEALYDDVLSRHPRVAVFDCDGTLWANNSGLDFMYWEIEEGLLPKAAVDMLLARYDLYLKGEVSEYDICGEMVSCHAELSVAEIRAACKRFAEERILPNIFPEMLELVRRVREQGADIWAVTSTASWIVWEGLVPFGIDMDRILGVELVCANERATAELIAVPTDEHKAYALERAGIPYPDVVFGNSIHDLHMLEIAKTPYAINPNPDLRDVAEERGWSVYEPRGGNRQYAIGNTQ
jgi:phosphoserine phosphatase